MKKNYKGQNGISIQIIADKINKEINKNKSKTPNLRKLKNSYNSGKIKTSDWGAISLGLDFLSKIMRDGFDAADRQLLDGNGDVSKIKKDIVNYRYIIEECVRRLRSDASLEYNLSKKIESLKGFSKVSQAARDGIILKQEKRTEIVDGKEKEVLYDTSMTSKEVMNALVSYEEQADRMKAMKINNYIELGMGIAGTVGALVSANKNKENRGINNLITLGTVAITGLKLVQGTAKTKDNQKYAEYGDKSNRLTFELLENEQVSDSVEDTSIENIRYLTIQQNKYGRKNNNSEFAFNAVTNLVIALISGAYVNKNITINENGRIDGKSLASALLSLQNVKEISRHFVNATRSIQDSRKEQEEFDRLCIKVNDILSQMEEKVFPLKGAKHKFNSFSVSNFKGQFYPKKNYETGEIEYSTTLDIPEFSVARGETVLLSGDSGSGKSTFLRFLKRGDINNRNQIELDNGEKVDNLGREYISFRPSINLGDETNILYQITGKESISDLSKQEIENLKNILGELHFESPELMQQLAKKKFMEFSTGQQRRLALSKVFYRIKDDTSVIIVDEPVGNVEDKLIREQLELIKEYANKRNAMLILTTHRLDLAEDLADKRYHINKDGVLEQIPIKKEKNKDDENDELEI